MKERNPRRPATTREKLIQLAVGIVVTLVFTLIALAVLVWVVTSNGMGH